MSISKRKLTMIIIGALDTLLCLLFGLLKNEYRCVFALPLAFTIVQTFTKIDELSDKYIGIRVYHLTTLVRYILLPFLIVLSENVTGKGQNPSEESIRIAVALMCAEFAVVSWTVSRFAAKRLVNQGLERRFSAENSPVMKSYFIYYMVIGISALWVLIHPSLLNNFSFGVFGGGNENISFFRGLDVRLIQISFMLLFCLTVEKTCKKAAQGGRNWGGYALSLIVGTIIMLVIRTENRAMLLVGILSVLITLCAAFPEKRKITLTVIIAIGTLALIALSLYRMLAVTAWRPNGGKIDFSVDGIAEILQLYISGPRNVALGIQAASETGVTFQTFFSDVFIWSGYVGNFLSETLGLEMQGTSYLFNKYLYGAALSGVGDQIVPMTVQSYWYFGYAGAMLFSFLCALALVKFDELLCKARSLNTIYINTMMAVITGMMMCYNISIFFLYFLNHYLIYFLVVVLANAWSNHVKIVRS